LTRDRNISAPSAQLRNWPRTSPQPVKLETFSNLPFPALGLRRPGKVEIRPEAEAALDKVGAVIQQFPNSKVWIDDYTDSIGSQNMNLALSKERAVAVKRWFGEEERSSRKKHHPEGFGEEKSVGPTINFDGIIPKAARKTGASRSRWKNSSAAAFFKPLSKCRSVLALAPLLDVRANFLKYHAVVSTD
jgi:hypothetical protein